MVLGWNHLVAHLVKTGALVRPVEQMMVLQDSKHYLSFNEDKQHDAGCRRLHEWLLGEFGPDFGQELD